MEIDHKLIYTLPIKFCLYVNSYEDGKDAYLFGYMTGLTYTKSLYKVLDRRWCTK